MKDHASPECSALKEVHCSRLRGNILFNMLDLLAEESHQTKQGLYLPSHVPRRSYNYFDQEASHVGISAISLMYGFSGLVCQ